MIDDIAEEITTTVALKLERLRTNLKGKEALLKSHGVSVLQEPAQLAQQLGLRVSENQGVQIQTVLRGGAAEQAGFAAGDEWLGLEPVSGAKRTKPRSGPQADGGWRMSRLDDLTFYAGSAKQVIALVARDKRLLRLQLTLPPPQSTWRLAVQDAVRVDRWLSPQA